MIVKEREYRGERDGLAARAEAAAMGRPGRRTHANPSRGRNVAHSRRQPFVDRMRKVKKACVGEKNVVVAKKMGC